MNRAFHPSPSDLKTCFLSSPNFDRSARMTYANTSKDPGTRPVQCLLVLGGALIALYYAEENWRGKHAWEVCRRQLEAQGASLDWSDYIPAPVPDEQNIFKAPKMSEWFASRTPTELSQRLGTLYAFAKQHNTNMLAEVTIVPPTSNIVASSADLVLRYCYSVLTIPPLSGTNAPTAGPGAVMKRLAVEDVGLEKQHI